MVEEGLFQVPLVGYQGETIDPDDPSLDFFGDLYYFSDSAGQPKARVIQLLDIDGMVVEFTEVEPGPAYVEIFSALSARFADADFDKYLNDPSWLEFLAIRGMLHVGLSTYHEVNGAYPAAIEDFLKSGLGPIDQESINPLTGDVFSFDGSEFGFYYEFVDRDNRSFYHVEEDGKPPTYTFMP